MAEGTAQAQRQDAREEAGRQGARARPRAGPARNDRPAPAVTPSVACWYSSAAHRPTVGWCPLSCNGTVTHSERSGNGDKLLYCEAHASWRCRTIRLRLVRPLRPGETT